MVKSPWSSRRGQVAVVNSPQCCPFSISAQNLPANQNAQVKRKLDLLKETLKKHEIDLAKIHVQKHMARGKTFADVPSLKCEIDGSIWDDALLQKTAYVAQLMVRLFRPNGDFMNDNNNPVTLEHHERDAFKWVCKQTIPSKQDGTPLPLKPDDADDADDNECKNWNVLDPQGYLWTSLNKPMRLMFYLNSDRIILILTWLRLFSSASEKNDRTLAIWPKSGAAGTTGYGLGIAGFDVTKDDTEVKETDLPQVHQYLENHMAEHSYVGAFF